MDKTIYEIANDYIDKNTELKLKIIDLKTEIKELKRVIRIMKMHITSAKIEAEKYENSGITDKEKDYIKFDELSTKEAMIIIGDKNNG